MSLKSALAVPPLWNELIRTRTYLCPLLSPLHLILGISDKFPKLPPNGMRVGGLGYWTI